jgi:hypothetical protein
VSCCLQDGLQKQFLSSAASQHTPLMQPGTKGVHPAYNGHECSVLRMSAHSQLPLAVSRSCDRQHAQWWIIHICKGSVLTCACVPYVLPAATPTCCLA